MTLTATILAPSPFRGLSTGCLPHPIHPVSHQHSTVGYLGIGSKTACKVHVTKAKAKVSTWVNMPNSSPPFLSQLHLEFKHEPPSPHHDNRHSPDICFVSLLASTSKAPTGSQYGPTGPGGSRKIYMPVDEDISLEFCDECFAVYKVEEFPKHACHD
ncbi:hypothetical protein K439DRAFT_1622645 [Ramaria rubella]|nr:hypothetical protein K439DRAFT_1622645 [Ramaria rubella]